MLKGKLSVEFGTYHKSCIANKERLVKSETNKSASNKTRSTKNIARKRNEIEWYFWKLKAEHTHVYKERERERGSTRKSSRRMCSGTDTVDDR